MARTTATPESSATALRARAAVVERVQRGYRDVDTTGPDGRVEWLRAALLDGRLEPWFQPIVSLPDGRVLGFEALARMRTDDAVLAPDRFIGIAEASGLIVPLGLQMLADAADAVARWRRQPALAGVYVSVNVSPMQLDDPAFADTVRAVLRANALPAQALVLEVTESGVAGPDAVETVSSVASTGVRLALDDFGTGFATLDNVRRLAVQMLKLDRSFVAGITDGGLDAVIVRNVLELAYELDLSVVAEGVERQEQADALAAWGCDAAQGWLFGRPAPQDRAARGGARPGASRTGVTGPTTSGAGANASTASTASPTSATPATISARPTTTATGSADPSPSPPARIETRALARALALTADDDTDEQRALVHAIATGIAKAMRLPGSTVAEVGAVAVCYDIARLRPLLTAAAMANLDASLVALTEPDAIADDTPLPARVVSVATRAVHAAGDGGSASDAQRLGQALADTSADLPNALANAVGRVARTISTLSIIPLGELLSQRDDHSHYASTTQRRLAALVSLSRALDPTTQFADFVAFLAEEVREIVGAASVSVSRWDRDAGVLRVVANVGYLGVDEERFPSDEVYPLAEYDSMFDMVIAGLPTVARADDPDLDAAEQQLLQRLGKGSGAGVPIYVEDRIWGELYATTSVDEPAFGPRDVALLTSIASVIGGALERGEYTERIARLAFEDPLTGLANRRAVDDLLAEVIEQTDEVVAVVMLDVNGLKQINDEFGHAVGDRVLRNVADALGEATRGMAGTTISRLGGDEFCIVIVGDEAYLAAEVIAKAAAHLRTAPAPHVTISAGAAMSTTVERTARDLFAAADHAQYVAKRSERLLLTADGAGPVAPAPVSTAIGPGVTGPAHPTRNAIDRRALRHSAQDGASADAMSAIEIANARVVEALRLTSGASAASVLEAVADALASTCDANRWGLSHVGEDGVMRLVRLRIRRTRPSAPFDPMLPEDETYVLADHPRSAAAISQGKAFWVHVDHDDHDEAERAVLGELGLTAVLAIGAHDDLGGWLLELYADRHTEDLGVFITLARLVALSLRAEHGAA